MKAGGIRNLITIRVDPKTLTLLNEWCINLKITNNINWVAVSNNTYITPSNNYKLIQFQYKLMMGISTCRYMRYKMGIVRDCPRCCQCKTHIELHTYKIIYKGGSEHLFYLKLINRTETIISDIV